MQDIISKLSLENITKSLTNGFRRFPLSVTTSCVITLFLFSLIYREDNVDIPTQKILTTLILVFFLSVGVSLSIEPHKEKSHSSGVQRASWEKGLHIFPVLYGILYYIGINRGIFGHLDAPFSFFLHLFGFIALIFFAPYISRIWKTLLIPTEDDTSPKTISLARFLINKRKGSVKHPISYDIEYANYFSQSAWIVVMSGVVGTSLFVLGSIAITAITTLFDFKSFFTEIYQFYAYWATISFALIAPLYGLIHYPRTDELSTTYYDQNRFFAFLIRYIATPAIWIYFIILYAYTVKFLLVGGDPNVSISWMIIGFSTFGYLTFIFSQPYEESSRMISIFRKYFPFIVLPQIVMLLYAIILRIAQYDLTTNRYFVVIFGIWLTITSLYLVLRKNPLLSVIPALLTIISIIISVGPWGAFQLPFSRQAGNLIRHLHEANILQGNHIVPLKNANDIPNTLSYQIDSEISYLCEYDNCQYIKDLFPDQVKKAEEKWKASGGEWTEESHPPQLTQWEILSMIKEEIKIRNAYESSLQNGVKYQDYFSESTFPYPLDIRSYETLVAIVDESDKPHKIPGAFDHGGNDWSYPVVSYDVHTQEVKYYNASGALEGAGKLVLSEELLSDVPTNPVDIKKLVYEIDLGKYHAKLIFGSLPVKNPHYSGDGDSKEWFSHAHGNALIKQK